MSAGLEREGREHIWSGGHREFQFATSARRERQAELRSEPLPGNRSIMNGLLYYAREREEREERRKFTLGHAIFLFVLGDRDRANDLM